MIFNIQKCSIHDGDGYPYHGAHGIPGGGDAGCDGRQSDPCQHHEVPVNEKFYHKVTLKYA